MNDRVLRRLQQTAPAAPDRFAWLRPRNDQFGVFVPVLMGAGFLLSGIAWLVERLARATARPTLERRLAARLDTLMLPPNHLQPIPVAAPSQGGNGRLTGADSNPAAEVRYGSHHAGHGSTLASGSRPAH